MKLLNEMFRHFNEFKCKLRDAGCVGYHERVEGTLESHLRFTNIITFNTIVKCLNASLSNFTSSRNVAANFLRQIYNKGGGLIV